MRSAARRIACAHQANHIKSMRAPPVSVLFAIAAITSLAGSADARRGALHHHVSWPGVCSVTSRHPCAPTVCSVFQRGPCIPEIQYPIGQDLRLTIVTADSGATSNGAEADYGPASGKAVADTRQTLDTIRDMFAALRACWVPPPDNKARPGMQMSVRLSFRTNGNVIGTPRVTYTSPDAPSEARHTYRDAISAALDRCTPLPFTAGLGGAVAGRPIAIRFVDERKAK